MEEKLRQFLNSKFKDSIIREDDFRREQSFYIKPESLFPICEALLENNELDEIPEKLLLAVKAAQEAELQARLQEAEKAAQTPIPSDTSSDDTTPSTSTENTVETSETTKIKSTSTPLTGT